MNLLKKIKTGLPAIICSLFLSLTGCSGNAPTPESENGVQAFPIASSEAEPSPEEIPLQELPLQEIPPQEASPQKVSPQEASSQEVSLQELPLQELSLQEAPAHILQTEDGRLLMLGENAALLDCKTLEIVEKNNNLGLDFSFHNFRTCKLTCLENEYIVLGQLLTLQKVGDGMFSSSEEPQLKLVRLGKTLEVLEVIDVDKLLGNNSVINNYELIDNGTKLLYDSGTGFFSYDMETKEHTTLITPANTTVKEARLSSLLSFGYLSEKKQILFTSFYDDGIHSDSMRTIGSVMPDGTGLNYEKEETHFWGNVWCFDKFALIEDGDFHESSEKANVFYYDTNGDIHVYPLADEYTSIQPSDKGQYFAVQSKTWGADNSCTGYVIRIYSSDSGQPIQEISCPFSEIGQNTVIANCVICEDTGRILILMYDRETKTNARFKIMEMKIG